MNHEPSLRGCRVLVIEPNDLVRWITVESLANFDAITDEVTSLERALQILRLGTRFDCVLASLDPQEQLTTMDYTIALRQEYTHGPILMTSFDHTSLHLSVPSEVYWLSKPYGAKELAEHLCKLMNPR